MKIDFNDKTVGGFTYEFVRGLSLEQAGAAEFGECMDTIGRVRNNDFDSWIREWADTADRVAAYAGRALKQDNKIAARKAFMRASNYYRMAAFYAAHTDPRHRALWEHSKDCFHSMIGIMRLPIECVDIPFEGVQLPGYFISAGEGQHPTLIALGGFDSTMEEVYSWIGAAAAEYGWNCLIFEGPGQWAALMNNPGLIFRPDYEKPVGAVVDYLLTRPDVDRNRLALIGYSMGGYLATRGALDPRIKACIPNTLVVDCGAAAREGMKGLMKSQYLLDKTFNLLLKINTPARWSFQHSQWTLGVHNAHEWVEVYQPFTLKGFEDRYRNPMLFLFSEDDISDAAAPSPTIVAGLVDFMLALPCDRYIRLFTRLEGASSHCQIGGLTYAQATIFEWLNHTLGGQPLAATSSPGTEEQFVALFSKYGGKEAGVRAGKLLKSAQIL
jgi:pimeloyl-ACP methyl ester carboxylesterase